MTIPRIAVLALAAAILISPVGAADEPSDPPTKKASKRAAGDGKKAPATALGFKVKDIDGKPVNLTRQYRGKVVMIVNVASKCGLTPQYNGLQSLYEQYKDKGFVILGFPANNFGGQEPDPEPTIKEFCTSKYNVTFPMFSKVSVKGDDICPLFKHLTDRDAGHDFGGDIRWNFNKFLVGRDGAVVGRFEPKVDPMSDDVTSAIEAALDAPAPEAQPRDKAKDGQKQAGKDKSKADSKGKSARKPRPKPDGD